MSGHQPPASIFRLALLPSVAVLTVLATLTTDPGSVQAQEPAVASSPAGRIHVVASEAADLPALTPGDTIVWHLGVSAAVADLGVIQRSLRASGELAEMGGAVTVEVRSCDVPYAGVACHGGEQLLLGPTPIEDLTLRAVDLGPQGADRPAWLAVHISLAPDVGDDAQARSATLSLAAAGQGVGPRNPRGSLPRTGFGLLPALLAAAGAIGAGLALAGGAAVLARGERVATDGRRSR